MRDSKSVRWFGVRMPIIAPVVAMPGQVLMFQPYAAGRDEIFVVQYDANGNPTTLRVGRELLYGDLDTLAQDRVIEELVSRADMKRYGLVPGKAVSTEVTRLRARGRAAALRMRVAMSAESEGTG